MAKDDGIDREDEIISFIMFSGERKIESCIIPFTFKVQIQGTNCLKFQAKK